MRVPQLLHPGGKNGQPFFPTSVSTLPNPNFAAAALQAASEVIIVFPVVLQFPLYCFEYGYTTAAFACALAVRFARSSTTFAAALCAAFVRCSAALCVAFVRCSTTALAAAFVRSSTTFAAFVRCSAALCVAFARSSTTFAALATAADLASCAFKTNIVLEAMDTPAIAVDFPIAMDLVGLKTP